MKSSFLRQISIKIRQNVELRDSIKLKEISRLSTRDAFLKRLIEDFLIKQACVLKLLFSKIGKNSIVFRDGPEEGGGRYF